MSIWSDLGYLPSDCERIESADEYCTESVEDLYIESHRQAYYKEFYEYLRENGMNPFDFYD